MESSASPPWGSLPLERYVLSQWLSRPEMDPSGRRRQFAREFAALGEAGRMPYLDGSNGAAVEGAPPASEWHAILSPLRTNFQRGMALPSTFKGFGRHWGRIWLRTCYGRGAKTLQQLSASQLDRYRQDVDADALEQVPLHLRQELSKERMPPPITLSDTDKAHDALLRRLNWDQALEVEENILNDAHLYDFGNDWARIFEIFPERLFEITLYKELPTLEPLLYRNACFEEYKQELVEDNFNLVELEQNSRHTLPYPDYPESDEERLKRIYRAKTSEFHREAIFGYLFVADRIALETQKVLIVFYDDRGRAVRLGRIEPAMCDDVSGAWENHAYDELPEFYKADIGPDYLPEAVPNLDFS